MLLNANLINLRFCFVIAILWLGSLVAMCEGSPITLSSEMIKISSGFKGAKLTVSGTQEKGQDVLIVVRGPEEKRRIFRKGKVYGVWLNKNAITFQRVPTFYKLMATRPLAQLLSKNRLKHYQLGLKDHYFVITEQSSPTLKVKDFKEAMIAEGVSKNIYTRAAMPLEMGKDSKFEAEIDFPSHLPRGVYWVEAFQIKDGKIVGAETLPLVVDQIGIGAYLGKLSQDHAFLYALLAILMAITAGWGANVIFRRK